MAFLAAIGSALGSSLSGIGTAASVVGTGVSALGAIQQGRAAQAAADYEAKQMGIKGAEERAAAGREAQMKRKEGELALSRQQALAAASGAGAGTDAPTIVKLMSDTAGQSAYNAGVVNYGGESRAQGLFDSARGRRASGKASYLGSVIGGFGQAASGLGKAFG